MAVLRALWSAITRLKTETIKQERDGAPLVPVDAENDDDVTVHIVLDDFGERGRAYVETDETTAEESTVIENIIAGAYSRPLRVVAFNTAEGWSRDVTAEIAWGVSDRVHIEQRTLTKSTQEFLQRALGLDLSAAD